jgi:hypothetical protein
METVSIFLRRVSEAIRDECEMFHFSGYTKP